MSRIMTPDELDELQTWEGPPAYFLALTKAVEVARLALHAVRRPEDCVTVLFKRLYFKYFERDLWPQPQSQL